MPVNAQAIECLPDILLGHMKRVPTKNPWRQKRYI